MAIFRLLFNSRAYLTISIAIIAVLGDYTTTVLDIPLVKALCDNATHSIIGGLSWCICYLSRDRIASDTRSGILEIFGCTLLSSVIDLDHFAAAKSFFLKDATGLTYRPLLHCSTIPLGLFLIMIILSYIFQNITLKLAALILFTAFMTHHVRDGTRRGLWFYPFGNTPPIPYVLYICLTCIVPYVAVLFDKLLIVRHYKETSDYSNVI